MSKSSVITAGIAGALITVGMMNAVDKGKEVEEVVFVEEEEDKSYEICGDKLSFSEMIEKKKDYRPHYFNEGDEVRCVWEKK